MIGVPGGKKGRNEADLIYVYFFNGWEQLFRITNPQMQGGQQISSKATKRNQHSDRCSISWYGWWLVRYMQFLTVHWPPHIWLVHFLYVYYTSISKFTLNFFISCLNRQLLYSHSIQNSVAWNRPLISDRFLWVRDAGVAYPGSSSLGSLRLQLRCPPGLQSSEGLAGAGRYASGVPYTPGKAHGSMACAQSLPHGSLHKACVSVCLCTVATGFPQNEPSKTESRGKL